VITGHLGVAAAARSGWRRTSLPWLLAGSIAPDVLDVGYAVVGVCSPHGLYSHTVPVIALLAPLLGIAAFFVTGSRATAVATGAMVVLHLPPDLVTGHKLYWPGGPLMGLDLYTKPLADFIIEAIVLATGWWLLRRAADAPRWATARLTLAALLLVQGTADVSKVSWKPTACETETEPASSR
jgi:hypothetical protein